MAHSTPQGILDDVAMVSNFAPYMTRTRSITGVLSVCMTLPSLGVGRRSRSVHCENVAVIDL